MDIGIQTGKPNSEIYQKQARSGALFDNPNTLSANEFSKMDVATAIQFIRDYAADNPTDIQDYIVKFVENNKANSSALQQLLNAKTGDGYAYLFIRPESI